MPETTLHLVAEWPEVALNPLRRSFPYPRNKQAEMDSLRRALTRISTGEVDGNCWTPEAAITYLREKVEEAAADLTGVAKPYNPHFTTWLNQSRYLKRKRVVVLNALDVCARILSSYPGVTVTAGNTDTWTPILAVIEASIADLRDTHGAGAADFIESRVKLFAECVSEWPLSDQRFVPGPKRFFEERRWNQDERTWYRTSQHTYESERAQVGRII